MTFKEFLKKFSGGLLCGITYPVLTVLSLAVHLAFVPFRALFQALKLTFGGMRSSSSYSDPRALAFIFAVIGFGCLIYNFGLFLIENNPLKLLTAPFTGATLGWQRGPKAFAAHENIDFLNTFFGALLCTILYPVISTIELVVKLPLFIFKSVADSFSWLRQRHLNPALSGLLTPLIAPFYLIYKIGEFAVKSILTAPFEGFYKGSDEGVVGILHHSFIAAIFHRFRQPLPRLRFNQDRAQAERDANALNNQQRHDRMFDRAVALRPQNLLLPYNNYRDGGEPYNRANEKLLDKINALPPASLASKVLLLEPEVTAFKKLLEEEKDQPTKTAYEAKLAEYEKELDESSCPISLNKPQEMKEAICVKRKDRWTHIYEKDDLLEHIRTESDSRRCRAKDVITREELTDEVNMSFSRGIPMELADKLRPFTELAREALRSKRLKPQAPAGNPAALFAAGQPQQKQGQVAVVKPAQKPVMAKSA